VTDSCYIHGQAFTPDPVKEEVLAPRAEREIVRLAKARTALVITFPVRKAQGRIDLSTSGAVDGSGSWISLSLSVPSTNVHYSLSLTALLGAVAGTPPHNDRYTLEC
jgi:hypothetical protein